MGPVVDDRWANCPHQSAATPQVSQSLAMANLTDGAIRQALKRVEKTKREESLADGEARGTGRLVLVLKPMPKRVTAEWMAQQWRDGKRIKAKLGNYPSMALAQAREVFTRDYADLIQKGARHQDRDRHTARNRGGSLHR